MSDVTDGLPVDEPLCLVHKDAYGKPPPPDFAADLKAIGEDAKKLLDRWEAAIRYAQNAVWELEEMVSQRESERNERGRRIRELQEQLARLRTLLAAKDEALLEAERFLVFWRGPHTDPTERQRVASKARQAREMH